MGFYFRGRRLQSGGLPYRSLTQQVEAAQLAELRAKKIVILEENEAAIARSGYPPVLRDVLLSGSGVADAGRTPTKLDERPRPSP
jgi:hypothetical protein